MPATAKPTQLPDPLPIEPLVRVDGGVSGGGRDASGPVFDLTVPIPGSKSLTNRALLMAALARGETTLRGVLTSDDTSAMLAALRELGCRAELVDAEAGVASVQGTGGRWPAEEADLFLGNAGTAMRFLAAAVNLGSDDGPYDYDGDPNPRAGRYVLRGIARMHERPIGQLVDALRVLGGRIDYRQREGYPPLEVRTEAQGPIRGGALTLEPTLSSQYISALLLIGPYLSGGLTLSFNGPVTSASYVRMTVGQMRGFGADVEVEQREGLLVGVRVGEGGYVAGDYAIEPDASSASYFLAAAAMFAGASVRVAGIGTGSLQGDAGFTSVLERMGAAVVVDAEGVRVRGTGVLRGVDVDLTDMPDMAQTLAAVAVFADGPTVMRNVGNLRLKETDRLAALEAELAKVGAKVAVSGTGNATSLTVTPSAVGSGVVGGPGGGDSVTFATYDDHRMAMALSLIGLRRPGVSIAEPGCVSKTFPAFFERLDMLRAGRG